MRGNSIQLAQFNREFGTYVIFDLLLLQLTKLYLKLKNKYKYKNKKIGLWPLEPRD